MGYLAPSLILFQLVSLNLANSYPNTFAAPDLLVAAPSLPGDTLKSL
jgi:hypothetical protein